MNFPFHSFRLDDISSWYDDDNYNKTDERIPSFSLALIFFWGCSLTTQLNKDNTEPHTQSVSVADNHGRNLKFDKIKHDISESDEWKRNYLSHDIVHTSVEVLSFMIELGENN